MLPRPARIAQHQHAKQGFPIGFRYDYLGTGWNAAVKRAGIRRRNPYHTRHTFTYWLLTVGADPAFIASRMGHETVQMVYEIYGMWIDDMNDGQVAVLNARLS